MRGRPQHLSSKMTSPATTTAGVGLRSDRGPILLALMVSTGLIAMDATILATAVPSVVRDLGGFSQFPWLFSVYLLAQAVSVPIYAKLADIVGRKPLMLFGIGLFLAGSVLCGFAWSMTSLIIFRAVQGLGAGAVQPMAITIAGDIYTVAERAKAQGYIASVWAVSSVVGPTLGGIFSQLGIWRWIFFVNVPLCLLAGALIARNFHEQVERQQHRIDYAGAGLLTVAMSLLILGILEGGQAWAWSLADEHRRPRRRGAAAARVPAGRAAGRRAGAAAVGAEPTAARHDDDAGAGCRRHPDRPDVVRPHLPRELARHRPRSSAGSPSRR